MVTIILSSGLRIGELVGERAARQTHTTRGLGLRAAGGAQGTHNQFPLRSLEDSGQVERVGKRNGQRVGAIAIGWKRFSCAKGKSSAPIS